MFHNFAKKCAAGGGCVNFPGSHAFSVDGRVWSYSGAAYSNVVQFTDGDRVELVRRERPHLVFDDGGALVALVNGVIAPGESGANNDASFTLVQALSAAR